ncbi:MAG TPA: universal stress protein [Xanthomonadaceae bacterium]|nr:universal stress protein [Xanthomonadaceae bacterium]
MQITLPQHDGEVTRLRDEHDRLAGLVRRHGAPASANVPRLLVAIDGSPASARVIAELVDWHDRHGWRFEPHLLNVQGFLAREAAEEYLDRFGTDDTAQARGLLAAAGIDHVLHIAMGDPAQHIVARAEAIGAGQIVMGTRGHGALGSALLGSVAYKVVHAAPMAVTLVR